MPTEVAKASAGQELLRCEQLVIGYGGEPLLPPLDVRIDRGKFLAVVGRNGAGKSTWFRTVLGLLPPLSGRVRRAAGLRCAYVSQASRLDSMLPILSRDLVSWGRLSGWSFLRPFSSRQDREGADRALIAVQAGALGHQTYRELSEGQKQRVLFARMLATDADVIFLDEPTAAMDAVAEQQTMERLRALTRTDGRAVVVISHVLSLSAHYADEVLYLDRDDALVLQGKPAEVFAHPVFRRQFGVAGPSEAIDVG